MENSTNLEALAGGDAGVNPTSSTENSWSMPDATPNNVYYIPDSEDEEVMSRGYGILDEKTGKVEYKDSSSSGKLSSCSSRSCLLTLHQRKRCEQHRRHEGLSVES